MTQRRTSSASSARTWTRCSATLSKKIGDGSETTSDAFTFSVTDGTTPVTGSFTITATSGLRVIPGAVLDLRRAMERQGFTEVEVGPADIEERGTDLLLTIPIQEGPRLRVVNLDLQGIESLDEDDKRTFCFDPRVIDWDRYVHDVHLPSIVVHARVRTAGGRREGGSAEV